MPINICLKNVIFCLFIFISLVKYNFLLQSVIKQDPETTEKAGEIFNQMINEDPDENCFTQNQSLKNA